MYNVTRTVYRYTYEATSYIGKVLKSRDWIKLCMYSYTYVANLKQILHSSYICNEHGLVAS